MNSLDELRTDMKNIAIPISINFQENYRLIILKIYIKKYICNLEPYISRTRGSKLGHRTVSIEQIQNVFEFSESQTYYIYWKSSHIYHSDISRFR
jgi:hypothetical protein